MTAHRVPSEPLAKIIRQWINLYPTERSLTVLAELTGIDEHLLELIDSGERKRVRFDDADMLLTRMERVHLWYSELAEWYAPPCKRKRRKRKPRTTGTTPLAPTVPARTARRGMSVR